MAVSDFVNSIITKDGFSATFSKFDNAVKGSGKELDRLGKVMSGGGLMALFGGAAGVYGATQIGKAVWQLGELGAQSLTTKASFDSLMRSVGQSPALLNQMKTAAGGTVTELQLMQAANTALAGTSGQLASELSAAIPRLIEAGRAAAMLNPAMGDAAFMTQSLITGIKRGSPMLIDNTGITLKLGEATQAYADSVGKSVNELTAQERSIAILRATLESSGVLIEQVGGNLGSMTSDMQSAKVAVEELKTALGELAAPTVTGAAGAAADIINSFRIALTGDEAEKLADKISGATQEIEKIKASNLPQWAKDAYMALQGLVFNVDDGRVKLQAIQAPIQNAARLSSEYATAATTAGVASANFSDQLAGLIATARGGGAAMQTLIGYINGVSAAAAGGGTYTGFLGGVDVLSQQQYVTITQQRIDMERALDVQVAAGILTQQQADYQLATFDKRVGDHIGTLRDQGKAITDTGTAYDDLKSKIGGALRPTFDLSGLTGGALGGMGGDSFDEAYKRLAAVALRPEELQIHAGDWADTFAKAGLTGLSPEDAQARARELVEAYSKGLDFSLIDREKIKDSVRQAIKAEELYQSVVDEIYAEMGKENPKAGQAGYALGTQINAGVLEAAKTGGAAYNSALAEAVSPYVARILAQQAARYEQ